MHGIVVVDLTSITSASAAKTVIWEALCDTPVGADVRLFLPRWDWWAPFAIDTLLELGNHLGSVTVESDAQTVRRWVVALREGSRHLHAVADR
ncbi:hypothetical protein [Geodermatophilus sp. SYSU D01105]